MEFVSCGEHFGRFEFDEKRQEGAQVRGSRGNMSIQRRCNDGDLPGGDAVGERNFYGGMTGSTGVNLGLPQERLGEILTKPGCGKRNLDLTRSNAGLRG